MFGKKNSKSIHHFSTFKITFFFCSNWCLILHIFIMRLSSKYRPLYKSQDALAITADCKVVMQCVQNLSACEEKKKKGAQWPLWLKNKIKKKPKYGENFYNLTRSFMRPYFFHLDHQTGGSAVCVDAAVDGTRHSNRSSPNLLRHSQHLLRIIQMCHCFLMGVMLSRQSGRLHQMCAWGGDLWKLTLCCQTNERKLIILDIHLIMGGAGGQELRAQACTTAHGSDKVTLGWRGFKAVAESSSFSSGNKFG